MQNEVVENVRDYILGGRADFTIFQEPDKQVKYSVRKNDSGKLYFLYTEKKTSKDLEYVGYFRKDDMSKLIVGAKGSKDCNVNAVNAFFWVLKRADKLPPKVHILHDGKCSMCRRKLTDAKSLMCGIGPSCRKKLEGRM